MADRSVLVRLRADISDFQRKMAAAGAETAGFAKRLEQADGRMANLVQTGLALAPALVPIGGLAVPAIAGLTAQLGLAATAGGVTLLAFQGVGDALDALNKYQLEPTADNFADLQMKMQALGPDGRDFVRTLQSIRPEMQALQDVAQAGVFPGMTDGLDEALHLMPQAERLIGTVSSTLGDLFAEAGDNLNDPRWVRFFDFLDKEAGPTLEAMGKSFGNVVEGLTNMMMAVDPLSDDFTHGMLDMSRSFNEWSQNLDSSQGFQDFVDYIRDTGPEALETLGSIGNALIELTEAAAPVGQATLPVIKALADGLAGIADSPVGPVLIGAAAAVGVLGRSMALLKTVGLMGGNGGGLIPTVLGVDKMRPALATIRETTTATKGLTAASKAQVVAAVAQDRTFRSSVAQAGKSAALLGGIAVAATGVADQTGLSNTAMLGLMGTIAGPLGAALGTGVGLTLDLAAANNTLESAVDAANRAMEAGTSTSDQRQAYRDLKTQIDDTKQSYHDFWTLDPTVNGSPIDGLKSDMKALGTWLTGGTGDAESALAGLKTDMQGTGDIADLMGAAFGRTGDQMRVAAGDAKALSGALAELQGWLDQRAALRNYEQSLDDLAAGLKKNSHAWDDSTDAGRANLAMLDATADGILQVASKMKNTDKRNNFLEGARADLAAMAKQFPGAAAAIDKIIGKLDKLGLTNPKPKVDLDTTSANGKAKDVQGLLKGLDGQKATPKTDMDTSGAKKGKNAVDQWIQELTGETARPKVTVETGQARSAIAGIQSALAAVRSKSITVTVNQVTGHSMVDPHADIHRAGGGQVFGPGGPRDDLINARLSNREWVMPVAAVDHYGPGFMAAVQAQRFADGGSPAYPGGSSSSSAADDAKKKQDEAKKKAEERERRERIRRLEKLLKGQQKLLDDQRADRDKAMQRRQEIRSSVTGGLRSNLFDTAADPWSANATANPTATLRGDLRNIKRMRDAIEKLAKKGIRGAALQEILTEGGLAGAELMAHESRAELGDYAQLYNRREQKLRSVSQVATSAVGVDRRIGDMSKDIRGIRDHMHDIQQAINEKSRKDHDSRQEAAGKIGTAMGKTAGSGFRSGMHR